MKDLVIELKIEKLSDWDLIQPLLHRLKISFTKKENRSIDNNEVGLDRDLEELQAMLANGVDASYYGDPVAYQKDVRSEHEQQFR